MATSASKCSRSHDSVNIISNNFSSSRTSLIKGTEDEEAVLSPSTLSTPIELTGMFGGFEEVSAELFAEPVGPVVVGRLEGHELADCVGCVEMD